MITIPYTVAYESKPLWKLLGVDFGCVELPQSCKEVIGIASFPTLTPLPKDDIILIKQDQLYVTLKYQRKNIYVGYFPKIKQLAILHLPLENGDCDFMEYTYYFN